MNNTHADAVRYIWIGCFIQCKDDATMKIRKNRGKATSECMFVATRNSHKLLQLAAIGSLSEYTYVSVCVNANTAQCVIGMKFLGEQLFRLLSVYITARKP